MLPCRKSIRSGDNGNNIFGPPGPENKVFGLALTIGRKGMLFYYEPGSTAARSGRALIVCVWVFSLLAIAGCNYSDSRLIRSEVVINDLVGTTMDADVFNTFINNSSVGVDFGPVRVFAGPESGSSQFWPSSMIDDYKNNKKDWAKQCFQDGGLRIKELDEGLYHIQARFRTPRAISGSKDHKTQAIEWLDKCDCPEKAGATGFEDYAIREIEKKMTHYLSSSLGENQGANISIADIRQMKRRLGTLVQTRRRILTDELGVYQRLRDHDVLAHNIERLDPGKRICFQSYSYNRGSEVDCGSLVSALVPGALSCMDWLGLVLPTDGSGEPGDILAGLDPITPLGAGWKDRPNSGKIYIKPTNPGDVTKGLDYWAPLDRVLNNSESSFPFGLLFTSNYKQTILIPDNEDLRIDRETDETLWPRGSILLLFEDATLRDFVQKQYAFESSKGADGKYACIGEEGTLHGGFHKCVTELVTEWLDIQKNAPGAQKGNAQDYFHDLVIPPNIRPFTQIPIYLNGDLRWVRTGASLLNILDEKFRISQEVMKARAAETGTMQHPPHHEAALVKRALSNFSLKRRRAGRLVEIQLDRVQSIDGLALPLAPGDELSW